MSWPAQLADQQNALDLRAARHRMAWTDWLDSLYIWLIASSHRQHLSMCNTHQ